VRHIHNTPLADFTKNIVPMVMLVLLGEAHSGLLTSLLSGMVCVANLEHSLRQRPRMVMMVISEGQMPGMGIALRVGMHVHLWCRPVQCG
jgi:hypothetical protein